MKYLQEESSLRDTVFGEVLAELLEARGIDVTPATVGELAEDAGMDGWRVLDRMGEPSVEGPDHLKGLALALGLSEAEMMELAFAFAYERRRPMPRPVRESAALK